MLFSPRTTAALLLLAAAACKTAESRSLESNRAPLDFVAWICADAARSEFTGADPLPYHAMAPATRREDGAWVVRYERRGDGRWAARAEGRILVEAPADDGALPQRADYAQNDGMRGWRGADGQFELWILDGPDGAEVHCASDSPDAEAALRHVAAALAFAAQLADDDVDEPQPCCATHAPWRAQTRIRLAARLRSRGELVAARSALSQARADAPRRQTLLVAIAMLDRALGQDELAAGSLAAAAHASQDTFTRTATDSAARASVARMRTQEGDSLRLAAKKGLDDGDLASAEALLLAARAAAPDPIADLALRHRLQSEQHDLRGALGTALLLREYGATSEGDLLLASALRQTGQAALARRALTRADLAARDLPRGRASATALGLLAEALRGIGATQTAAPPR